MSIDLWETSPLQQYPLQRKILEDAKRVTFRVHWSDYTEDLYILKDFYNEPSNRKAIEDAVIKAKEMTDKKKKDPNSTNTDYSVHLEKNDGTYDRIHNIDNLNKFMKKEGGSSNNMYRKSMIKKFILGKERVIYLGKNNKQYIKKNNSFIAIKDISN